MLEKELVQVVHNVDYKFAILLHKMKRANIVNLTEVSGLKGRGIVNLYTRGCKIFVKAPSKKEGEQAIEKISDFIDDLNIIRVDVKAELARKIFAFKKIRMQLRQRNLFIFGTNR